MKRSLTVLAIAFLLGVGIYMAMPNEVTAYTCGYGCGGHIFYGVPNYPDCPPDLCADLIKYYYPPTVCDHECPAAKLLGCYVCD